MLGAMNKKWLVIKKLQDKMISVLSFILSSMLALNISKQVSSLIPVQMEENLENSISQAEIEIGKKY